MTDRFTSMATTPTSGSIITSGRILVVDDDVVARTVLCRRLSTRGFTVREAPDGAAALEIAAGGWPQAIVLDYVMPGMDGLQVVQQMRANPATAELPVVLLTALNDTQAVVTAFEQGVDDYVIKPAHPDEVTVRLYRLLRQAERRALLEQAATVDALTGLLNRRGVQEMSARISAEKPVNGVVACLLFDLDHFKRVNDLLGHPAGDAVLAEVARRLRGCLRQSDIAGRHGGEEFIALVPATSKMVALAVAERIRGAVAATPIFTDKGPVDLTISGGIALRDADEAWEELIARADTALYRAKANGRNQIVLADEAQPAAARLGEKAIA
jgi:two-component system, cell cycle response regulator